MKPLFVADLHYALKQFDWLGANAAKYDCVVVGGDLLDLSSALEIDVQAVVILKYLGWIAAQTRLLVSSGNHDGDSRSAADESVAAWLQEARGPRLAVDGDAVEMGGALLTVCPWWDGPASRAELEQLLERDAARAHEHWIWIHHAPPHESPVSWTGRKFAGDEYLVRWIQRHQPDLVLSGHIHNAPFQVEGSWIERLGATWVFNPGRQPGAWPTYLAFDLAERTVEWMSIEGQCLRKLDR